MTRRILLSLLWLVMLALPRLAAAQVTPAAGLTPPDDTQAISVGAVIYYDYTYQKTPEDQGRRRQRRITSARSRSRAPTSTSPATFRTSCRSASRRTSCARSTAADAALNGSLVFRLKYGFAQFNLDAVDRRLEESWGRLGMQQTPYIDCAKSIYRYRFQGTVVRRAQSGSMSSSDAGVSFHTNLPNNYGDVHAGFYNGEGYNRADVNNAEAFDVPRHVAAVRRQDRPTAAASASRGSGRQRRRQRRAPRSRPLRNDLRAQVLQRRLRLSESERSGAARRMRRDRSCANVKSGGWSISVTPFFKEKGNGPEVLLRYDDYKPNNGASVPMSSRRRSCAKRRSLASPTGSRIRAATRPPPCSSTSTA